jgi:hypothetical protein
VGVDFEKEMDLEFEQVIRVLSTYLMPYHKMVLLHLILICSGGGSGQQSGATCSDF